MIALQLSEDRISFTERRNQIIDGLHNLPGQIKKVLELDIQLKQLAATVSMNKSLLLMGRGYQYVDQLVFRQLFYLSRQQVCHLPRRGAQNQRN